ncbi:hypothetical protein B0A52_05614 [Exophiala mesophila]|uniref:Uncharacterized protein n=1 Tax=Exophiala mesophila TaxID=212818 RepID=A0A438N3G1_EXOME|nr:hypothetical protein B0A52_05614 [Exophiala mesophila]
MAPQFGHIMAWLLNAESDLDDEVQILRELAYESLQETAYFDVLSREEDERMNRGMSLQALYEEAYYDTLEQEEDDRMSREMALEALYEEAYYDTLEQEEDDRMSREMALEALYEEAYYDTLEQEDDRPVNDAIFERVEAVGKIIGISIDSIQSLVVLSGSVMHVMETFMKGSDVLAETIRTAVNGTETRTKTSKAVVEVVDALFKLSKALVEIVRKSINMAEAWTKTVEPLRQIFAFWFEDPEALTKAAGIAVDAVEAVLKVPETFIQAAWITIDLVETVPKITVAKTVRSAVNSVEASAKSVKVLSQTTKALVQGSKTLRSEVLTQLPSIREKAFEAMVEIVGERFISSFPGASIEISVLYWNRRLTEDYFQVSIYDDNLSSNEKRESLRCCKRLITNAGGVVREDLGAVLGLILFTLPDDVANPIKEDDEKFKGKIYTRFWHKTGNTRGSH